MMSFRLFSPLEKGPILKVQIDKDLDFLFLLASTIGVTISSKSVKTVMR